MKKTILLIMAAGIGSRFGQGIKQLEPVGPSGEIIIDYSIHDAVIAGFNKIVFIIRKDIEKDFKEIIGNRIYSQLKLLNIDVEYAFQELENIPASLPEGRTKPWGTGQAVLAAKDFIDAPFAVINADDYYGKESFKQIHDWLIDDHSENSIALSGFVLKNTLSDNGGVTRGICKLSDDGKHICDVIETYDIIKKENKIINSNGEELDPGLYVSMNMWGFPGNPPSFIKMLEKGFVEFFDEKVPSAPLKSEYLLPIFIGEKLKEEKCKVTLLPTNDKWFGVTYKEDKEAVVNEMHNLIDEGIYSVKLYSDLI